MDGNRGNDIDGEFRDDRAGTSISLSADGSVVAIGSTFHDIGKGQVLFEYADSAENGWEQGK